MEIAWKKYAYTFLITAVIFATAIFTSNYFSQKRVKEIQNIERDIAVDILSSETQFSLLEELSCEDIGNSFLSKELASLGDKLFYTEKNRGVSDPEVISLKKYYSLLQIKDYLLMKKVGEKCDSQAFSIIYFYSNKGDCNDCTKEGYVLTRLREEYPELRVYSFDYNIESSVLQTLTSIYHVENNLPALLIGDGVYYGFKSIDDIKEIIPELKEIDEQRELEKEEEELENIEEVEEE